MPTDSWINETLYPDWGQRFVVKRELARVKSEFQDIVIFESRVARPGDGAGWRHPDHRGRRVRLSGDADPCAAAGAWCGGECADHRRRRRRRAAARAAARQREARSDGGDRRRGHPPVEGIPAEDRRRRLERPARGGDRRRRHRLREACAGAARSMSSSSIRPIRSAWARCCSPTNSITIALAS